jgi:hypothetical protein
MTNPHDAAPQPGLPAVDAAMQEYANHRIAEINDDPTLHAQTPDATKVALATISLAPTVETAGGYAEQDGPAYTTHDIDESLARQPRHAREAAAPIEAGEVTQGTGPVGLADRVRQLQQAGGLQGHPGGRGLGQQLLARHPLDMSPAAVAQRQSARRTWEARHQVQ